MERLGEHFNLYDFFGYLFPGAVALSAAVYVTVELNLLAFSFTGDTFTKLFESVVLLGLAYVLGHMIQSLASFVETKWVYREGKFFGRKYPSEAFMEKDNDHFDKSFKKNLILAATETFNLSKDYPKQGIFELCYSLVVQRGATQRTERFLGLQAFYRGMYLTLVSTSAILIVFNLLRTTSMLVYFLSVVMLLTGVIFYRRYIYFGEKFADAIYRDFYVFKYGKSAGKTELSS